MKKLLLYFCCLPILASGQNFHFSTRLGLAGYQGDLKSNVLSQLNFMGSLGALYDLSEHITARSYLTLSKLRGDDKKGNATMQQRNLNFQTKLFDWELTAQYNLYSLNERWWTPYAFAGVGIYHFNPYTKDVQGTKVYLQPLSLEGQGFLPGVAPYKKTQFSIPMGIGANYTLGEDTRVGIELGYRKLFTDYLDDVSGTYVDETALRSARGQEAVDLAWRGYEINGQPYPKAGAPRGNSKSKDDYYYIALTFSLRYWFDKYKEIAGIPASHKDKKVGCPASRGY
jgi:hypothetical protein